MSLKIIAAVYGTENAGTDVTAKCQQLVNSGNDDIPVNNDTFGDPDVGSTKYFGIIYKDAQGNQLSLGAKEGDVLDLVPVAVQRN